MTESWHLKVDWAEKHFADFEREVRRYSLTDPYRAERRIIKVKGQPQIWRYVLRLDQPNPETSDRLALLLGDLIHNLRSALDHLAAAMVPSDRKTKCYFPVLAKDLWVRDAQRRFIVGGIEGREARKSFERATRGMLPEAVAAIKRLQPYAVTSISHAGSDALTVVSRLDNADKHSRLIAYVARLNGVHWALQLPGSELKRGKLAGPLEDGTALFNLNPASLGLTSDLEVQVKVSGTPLIAIEVGDEKFRLPINVLLIVAGATGHWRRVVFPTFEPIIAREREARKLRGRHGQRPTN